MSPGFELFSSKTNYLALVARVFSAPFQNILSPSFQRVILEYSLDHVIFQKAVSSLPATHPIFSERQGACLVLTLLFSMFVKGAEAQTHRHKLA